MSFFFSFNSLSGLKLPATCAALVFGAACAGEVAYAVPTLTRPPLGTLGKQCEPLHSLDQGLYASRDIVNPAHWFTPYQRTGA